jgi:UPF0271 protein
MALSLTLNTDVGAGVGEDEAILSHVDIAFIASGATVISENYARHLVRLCQKAKIAIGAHVSYIAHENLGSRVLMMSPSLIAATVRNQLAWFSRITRDEAATISHVKLRGVLSDFASSDPDVAIAIAETIFAFDTSLVMTVGSTSSFIEASKRIGQNILREVCADRIYDSNGALRPRTLPGALIDDQAQCLAQVMSAAEHNFVRAFDGSRVWLEADTFSIRNESSKSVALANYLKDQFGPNALR